MPNIFGTEYTHTPTHTHNYTHKCPPICPSNLYSHGPNSMTLGGLQYKDKNRLGINKNFTTKPRSLKLLPNLNRGDRLH